MRAKEFIAERRKTGKISHRLQQATRGLNKFRDPGGFDRTYELNRVMMAAACSDGHSPLDMNAESWAGRYNTAHPYTEVEQQMMKQAYSAVGAESIDLNHGDLRSEEVKIVNKKSPVAAFKGFGKSK
jgi:hypothetical protein